MNAEQTWPETLSWLQEYSQYTWVALVLFAIPLLVLARYRIYPSVRLCVVGLLAAMVTLLLPTSNDVLVAVVAIDVLVVLVACGDLASVRNATRFSAARKTGRICSLRGHHSVSLSIENHSGRKQRLNVRDDLPESFETTEGEFSIEIPRRSRAHLKYRFRPTVRGAQRMQWVFVRSRTRLGLWNVYLRLAAQSTLHVYPDMQQLAKYAVLARTNRLSLMGVRRTRKIGQDNEFERLRDYTQDDNYKHVDWRATARRNKLTTRDYQTSQSQRIVFLVDCGRMMTNESQGLSLLDHALNSMLMLSYVALRQGDSAGLICFSDRVHTYVPPVGGMQQMNQLLHASYDRFPTLVESRFDEAFLYMRSRCKKRSLVVLISNVIDEVNAHQVHQYLSTLTGRHLPLGVLLRDHRLFDAANQPTDIYQGAAAADILIWRHQVLTDLQHRGVMALDVFPEEMTAPLVNAYLEIKARHLL